MGKSKPFYSLEENFLLSEKTPGEPIELVANILVDADALVALVKINDPNHQKALQISNSLQKRGCSWCVSPFTVGEVITVISYKMSHTAAKNVLKELRKLGLVEWALKDEHAALADKWFFKQNKKGTSYFDCYNMALLERYNKDLKVIFSFDSVYKRSGFKTAEEII